MAKKKAFFREATKAQIEKKKRVEISRLTDIGKLGENEFTVILPFIPRGFGSARKFMKHGPEVKPKRQYSTEQALRESQTPVQLREKAFNRIRGHNFCGYTFMPFVGKDQRKRKFSLVECLEGARLFAYAHQVDGTSIDIKPYADAKRASIDGATIVATVPSRTQGEPRMQLKIVSIPVVDSPGKYALAYNLGSDHSCPAKRFNIRFRYADDKEISGIINMCAHEIAVNLSTIDHYWEEKNLIPLQMCLAAIPTQKTVDYYLKWGNNVLFFDESLKAEDKLRKPNRAEREIGLWALVQSFNHDRTFYSKESRDGDVADYRWT